MDVRLRSRRRNRDATDLEEPVVLPNVCPECGGPGYLETINLIREVKAQSCQDCRLVWETPID